MLATWGTSTGFNPASLFSGGVQGAWYDPSDNTTMFQTLGGPAVTAVEQAVGLILDKSKGLQVTQISQNSNFSAGGTDWVAQAGWTVIVGSASVVTTTGGRYIRTATDAVANSWYAITFTVSSITGGTLSGAAGTAITPVNVTTAGTYTHYVNASGAGGVGLFAGANTTATVTSIDAKLIAGNHAVQTTSASRPTLRARYNLLTYSEQFNDAAWTKQNTTVTANATTAPDGTLTADKVIPNTTLGAHAIRQDVTTLAQPYVFSIYAKASEYIWLILANTTAAQSRTFNLQTGVVGTSSAGTSTATITSVGNGWYRCTITGTATAASNAFRAYVTTTDDVNSNFSGDDVSGMFMWGAQVVPTAVFPSNVYQRIAASTDYATGAAFPQYLAFDGTDDSLFTTNVDFATVTSDGAARRNLLLNPTQFDASGWTTLNATVTANATAAPDSTTTADKLIENTATGVHTVLLSSFLTITSGATYTLSIYAKAAERTILYLRDNGTSAVGVYFDLVNGVITSQEASVVAASITAVGSGWYRCVVTYVAGSTTGNPQPRLVLSGTTQSYTGDGTSGLFIWGMQFETGSTATAFQNIGTDKMTVWSGLSKLSDAAIGAVVELSATSGGANNGSFMLSSAGQASAGAKYGSTLRGTSLIYSDTPASYASPISNVITLQSDIDLATAALEQTMRINASNVALTTVGANAGVGNFGTYPLFIGRRNNASLPFNGRIYSLIVRGAASNSSQVAQTERYVASKTPLGVVP